MKIQIILNWGKSYYCKIECLSFIKAQRKYKYDNYIEIILMNINKVCIEKWTFYCARKNKFTESGEVGLIVVPMFFSVWIGKKYTWKLYLAIGLPEIPNVYESLETDYSTICPIMYGGESKCKFTNVERYLNEVKSKHIWYFMNSYSDRNIFYEFILWQKYVLTGTIKTASFPKKKVFHITSDRLRITSDTLNCSNSKQI